MSATGRPGDVYVSGAKPRREARVRERGRRPKAQRSDSRKRSLTAANIGARSAKVPYDGAPVTVALGYHFANADRIVGTVLPCMNIH